MGRMTTGWMELSRLPASEPPTVVKQELTPLSWAPAGKLEEGGWSREGCWLKEASHKRRWEQVGVGGCGGVERWQWEGGQAMAGATKGGSVGPLVERRHGQPAGRQAVKLGFKQAGRSRGVPSSALLKQLVAHLCRQRSAGGPPRGCWPAGAGWWRLQARGKGQGAKQGRMGGCEGGNQLAKQPALTGTAVPCRSQPGHCSGACRPLAKPGGPRTLQAHIGKAPQA